MLSAQEGNILVRLARQTIEEYVGLPPSDPVSARELASPALQEKHGIFVTLHKNNRLRGCVGSLLGVESVVDGVRRHAINAAFHDQRFPMVSAEEVAELQIEVSVLSDPEPLSYSDGMDLIRRLRPHEDGVIIRAPNGASATFLPQVWEQLPRPQQFLDHLCLKAGLPADFWQSGELRVETYKVIHFQEQR